MRTVAQELKGAPMASVVTDFPHKVGVVEHIWIPLSDGCRLAAKLWIPQGAEEEPVPAVLEYIPYRKNDGTLRIDTPRDAYLAGNGYLAEAGSTTTPGRARRPQRRSFTLGLVGVLSVSAARPAGSRCRV
jgi:hypothetical protein